MKIKNITALALGIALVGGTVWYVSQQPRQLVFVGDTQERVMLMLGEPSISFPHNDSVVQWYAGYEITLNDGTVTEVFLKPVESEEEKEERKLREELAEKRLRQSYGIIADKENISYKAWLKREELRMREERAKRAAAEAYARRKLEKEKLLMRTN